MTIYEKLKFRDFGLMMCTPFSLFSSRVPRWQLVLSFGLMVTQLPHNSRFATRGAYVC